MSNERLIQLEEITKVVVEEVHGNFALRGWERPEVRVEWDDDIHERQENGVLYLELHGDGQLDVPHHVNLVVATVHGDLQMNDVPTTLELNIVHGDTKLENMGAIRAEVIHGDVNIHDIVGPLVIENVDGDLNARRISNAVTVNNISGDARLHAVETLRVGNVTGDLTLREARGAVHVENVGGDLKADAVRGNLDCTVGGDALLRMESQREQAYRINAGGDITCRLNADASVAISANCGGEINVKQLPIQVQQEAHSLQTVLGDGSAAIELTAGGDITLAGRERSVEWEFDFSGDVADEIGNKAAAYAERVAKQVEQQMSHLANHLDEKFAKFGNNEEFAKNIQEKVQSAMQRAEEKISEAMRHAEQRARDAETRFADRHARHEARYEGSGGRRSGHVRPQHMHHPRPVTPPTAPAAPQAPAVTSEERMMILKMLSEGQISVEQADQLLAALGGKVEV